MAQEILSTSLISETLGTAGGLRVTIHPEYSGRGMFGVTCFGVSGSIGDIIEFMVALSMESAEAMHMARETRTDDFGRRIIAYWPGHCLASDFNLEDIEREHGVEDYE